MIYRSQNENFQFEEDPFPKNVQGIGIIHHEVLLLMNSSQTNPSVKSMKIKYFDLYYTVIKKRNENEVVHNNYEDNEEE